MEQKKLGFGFMRLPYKYDVSRQKIEMDMAAVCSMVDTYIEGGYTYFETAKPYMFGRSEEVIRECVSKRYARDKFLLADKLPFDLSSGIDFEKVFQGQLNRCGVSYFDAYYIHNMGMRIFEKYEKMGAFDFLKRLKSEGRALKTGFSFHDTADVLEKILSKHSEVDFVQLQINYWDWESPNIQSRKCYEVARKYNKEIFVMEPVKGGALAKLPEKGMEKLREIDTGITPVEFAFRFVASLDGVERILSGMASVGQVQDNIRIFNAMKGFSAEEMCTAQEIVAILNKEFKIPCTACGYCMDKCPAQIRIPQIFGLYNSYCTAAESDRTALSRHQLLYKSIHGGRISECFNCGQCEKVCPQHIPVRQYLTESDNYLKKKNTYTVIKNVQIVIALLKKFNIRHLVLSPGTRNIPFVHSVEGDPFFRCYSVVDERSAAHFALGMAQESGEPVLISCTSSSACCNYLSAVTEAYYQGVPLVVLTGDRDLRREGQMEDQMIHQYGMYKDVCKRYVQLPDVITDEDFWHCERLVNEALLELNHHGKGPVHINIPVFHHLSQYTASLPDVKKITRHEIENQFSEWEDVVNRLEKAEKIMIIYGQCSRASSVLEELLDQFCTQYNAVIVTEHMANLHCKHAFNPFVLLDAALPDRFPEELLPNIVITMEGRVASKIKSLLRAHHDKMEHWEISETGEVVDVFRSLTDIFECSSQYFLNVSLKKKKSSTDVITYHSLWRKYLSQINLSDIPFSNTYVIRELTKAMPKNSILHLSVLNSIRITQFFELPENTKVYANIGADGIDGALSTFLGHAAVTNRLCFLIVGDLSFFYDMNAAGIRHIGNNVRILMINNGGGGEFHFTFGKIIPETIDQYVAAGHSMSARGWIESRGFRYMTASNEEGLSINMSEFVRNNQDSPVFFEVFTNKDTDGETLRRIFEVNRNEVLESGKPAMLTVAGTTVRSLHIKYLFPFDMLLSKGNRIVIYGAGDVGKNYYSQVNGNGNCRLIAWIDKAAKELEKSGMPVEDISVLKEREYDAVVIGIKGDGIAKQVRQDLMAEGVLEEKIVWSIVEI